MVNEEAQYHRWRVGVVGGAAFTLFLRLTLFALRSPWLVQALRRCFASSALYVAIRFTALLGAEKVNHQIPRLGFGVTYHIGKFGAHQFSPCEPEKSARFGS